LQRHFLADPGDAANPPPDANPTTLGGLQTATATDVGRTNNFGGAVTLLIKLNDALSITPRVLFQKSADLADNRSLAAETLGRPRHVVNQPRTPGIQCRASF
jgi:hypothetical protein